MCSLPLGFICSGLCAAEPFFSLESEEEKVFVCANMCLLWEQRYDPPVSFQVLTDKYDEAQYINPYPEELTVFVLSATKRGDYDRWLGFWTLLSQKILNKKDSSSALIERRKNGGVSYFLRRITLI